MLLYVLDIILEEVMLPGIWKKETQEKINQVYSGVAQAFTAKVEEQGCRTLHTHVQVWLKECIELSEGLHSEKRHVEQFVSHEI
jgi:galactose-1-phosphate uridylyltransferase